MAGDNAKLSVLYSTNPPAKLATVDGKSVTPADEAAFWAGLKGGGLRAAVLQIAGTEALRPDVREIVFQLQLTLVGSGQGGTRKLFASVGQIWVNTKAPGAAWQIVQGVRTDLARLPQPVKVNPDLYPDNANAHAEIAAAEARAARENKHVLLLFGGQWCFDCHVLDAAFHLPEIARVVDSSYEVVHVDIGHYDKNLDIVARCGTSIAKGVPALAVIDAKGKVLFGQKNGEFEKTRALGPEDLLAFLNRYKPAAPRSN